MKWYYLSFNDREIFEGIDQKFINDFVLFMHTHKQPDKLVLYKLSFSPPSGSVYYLSTPAELDSEIKKILAHLNVRLTFRPNLNVLEPIYGSK